VKEIPATGKGKQVHARRGVEASSPSPGSPAPKGGAPIAAKQQQQQPKRDTLVSAKDLVTKPKPRGVLFDSAAGASCLPPSLAAGRTAIAGRRGPALENAQGGAISGTGNLYSVPLHTAAYVLPAEFTEADVIQPILSAWAYAGPGGEFEAHLRPADPILKHTKTNTIIPLRWEDGVCKLGASEGDIADAQEVVAKLVGRVAGVAMVRGARGVPEPADNSGLRRSPKFRSTPAPNSSRPKNNGPEIQSTKEHNQDEREQENRDKRNRDNRNDRDNQNKKNEREETKKAYLTQVATLGSEAWRLSRAHLRELARGLGARAVAGADGSVSKKALFRAVTGVLPAGAGLGLRPGRPGREIP
jgi:hypothetical protein